MFVQADTELSMSFDDAASALERALADGGLVPESQRAMAEGLSFLMPVGPRGSRFPSRQVVVKICPLGRDPRHLAWALRWETEGGAGRLFPALDADLELSEEGEGDRSRLSIIGRYQPPLGGVGMGLDQVIMSKVASATMSAMLREIAAHLEDMST